MSFNKLGKKPSLTFSKVAKKRLNSKDCDIGYDDTLTEHKLKKAKR